MSMTDPISDLISRIRNGQLSSLKKITVPSSNIKLSILEVLKREGYIVGFKEVKKSSSISVIEIELKYHNGEPVIQKISRVSKPGRRVFTKISSLGKFFNGLGTYVLSTPKGVLSDHEARLQNVGGELLISVY